MSATPSGYPSHPKLSESDMYEVLRRGAPLRWFEPFAVLGQQRFGGLQQLLAGQHVEELHRLG